MSLEPGARDSVEYKQRKIFPPAHTDDSPTPHWKRNGDPSPSLPSADNPRATATLPIHTTSGDTATASCPLALCSADSERVHVGTGTHSHRHFGLRRANDPCVTLPRISRVSSRSRSRPARNLGCLLEVEGGDLDERPSEGDRGVGTARAAGEEREGEPEARRDARCSVARSAAWPRLAWPQPLSGMLRQRAYLCRADRTQGDEEERRR